MSFVAYKHLIMKNAYLVIVLGIAFASPSYTQGFLKKLTDKAIDRTIQKAEDKLVDKLAEKIANQAVKPIDSFVDSLFIESYERESGEKYDPENSAKMNAALSAMFGTVELPEKYEFDFTMEVEVKDFGKKKANKMKMFVCKNRAYFGMEQDQDDKKMLIVFDNENNAMVTYDFEKNECMAIPLNSTLMSAFGEMAMEEEVAKQNLKIEETSKTKKILGYKSKKYLYKTDDADSEVYISTEVPFSWDDSFGTMMTQFAPNFYKNNPEHHVKGMMLEARSKRKEDGKKSEWKAKKIKEEKTTLNNSDFPQRSLGTYGNQ